jgi:hypothetical protein
VELCVTRLRYAQIHGFSRLAAEPGDKADAEPLAPDKDNTLGEVPPLTSPPAFDARKRVRAVIPNEAQCTGSDQSRHSSAPGHGKYLLSLRVKSGHPHDAQRPAIRVSLTGHPACRATEVGDKAFDPLLEMVLRCEITAPE